MSDSDTIDEPAPTVVGPQPAERRGGRRIRVPRGLEKLVALGGLGAEWRGKVLADPPAAAREAGLELTEVETDVAASVPRDALAQMIDSFGKRLPRPKSLRRMAAGAAAAALLASALSGCGGEDEVLTLGIRPDRPPAEPREEEEREPEPAPPATQGHRADEPDRP
jgi:hypothetical protein